MPWSNSPLVLYHGCDDVSAASIVIPVNPNRHGIHLSRGKSLVDFGQGFYTTTYVIKDSDQISFHTVLALLILSTPTIEAQATSQADPFLR
jgi:hypothetical protein